MAKATRKLSDIKFEHTGAHCALVGPSIGGAANGYTTLITKATAGIPSTVIEKATDVTVTMQFTDFLRRFFLMYWEDAEVLSMALGFGPTDDVLTEDMTYQDYLNAQVANIQIMKSVYAAQNVEKALGELAPEIMLSLLQTQEVVEKAMSSVLPLGESLDDNPSTNKEHTMETILKSAHEEIVTKAVAEAVTPVQKALDEQTLVLKSAQEKITAFEAAAVTAKAEVRKSALTEVVAAESVEALLKAYSALDDESFAVALEVLKTQRAAVDNSDMLVEKGLNGSAEQDPAKVDKLAEILKAKYPQKTQGVK